MTLELRIAHLYGDIMNTYGDWGNIAALQYRAERRGIQTVVDTVSIGDDFQPDGYDFILFGGGQDAGQEVVAADLGRIGPKLIKAVEADVALLAVCGGYQLLGSSYQTGQGQILEGVGMLPIRTVAGRQRMMHNLVVALHPSLTIGRKPSATLVGFENHSGQTFLAEGAVPLGRVIKGSGNNGQDGTEGVVYRQAVGTYLHGSCLPKNPHLADWFLEAGLRHRYGEVSLVSLDDDLEWRAHTFAASLKA